MPDPGPPRALALGIGNAVHAALEWSARRGFEAPGDELLERLLLREGLAGEPEALERVRGYGRRPGSTASSAPSSGGRASVAPEVGFALRLGETVVRGQIDLLARGTDSPAWSTTRPTRFTATARPSSPTATEPSARSTRWLPTPATVPGSPTCSSKHRLSR